MVFYRKYRPQTISELDLSDVREKLTAILSSKETPHAFLFTGPRGLGKTSSARILAKAINCESRGKGKGGSGKKKELDPSPLTLNAAIEPCNSCDICRSITEGSHIDIIEIDAASNRGVDEIRSLREKVKFSPSQLRKKVYIIDEVHMLTNEAFNALLKTLEEPPGHVIFILATTEAHKIPQTILSRTYSIKFEKPTLSEITNSLKRIVKGENLEIDEKAYQKIFDLSEGSFRDASKILEELSLNSEGKKIDLEVLEKVYKSGSTLSQAENLLTTIYAKDMQAGLKVIEQMANEGIDFKTVIEQMVEKIRLDLVSGKNSQSINDLKKLLVLLNEAYAGLKFAVVPQLPLELAVIEICLIVNSQELIVEAESKKQEVREQETRNKEQLTSKNEQDANENEQVSNSDNHKSEIANAQRPEPKDQRSKSKDQSPNGDLLRQLIEIVHQEDKRIAAFLRSCKSASVEGKILILSTPYSLHADKLSKPDYREVILKSVFDIDQNINDLKVVTV